MTTTPHLETVDLVEGQKNAATAVNAANLILDSIVQLWVNDAAPSTTPPTSGLIDGATYIVPDSATGDWAGQDRKIAVWQSGWVFHTPERGWRAWDARLDRKMVFLGEHGGGGRWQQFQAARVTPMNDNSGGNSKQTIGAGVGIHEITFPLRLADVTGTMDLLTNYDPGYRFQLMEIRFICQTPSTDTFVSIDLNLEIGTTNTTGGTLNLTDFSAATLGQITTGAVVTANGLGTDSQSFSVEATISTVFTDGDGHISIKLQNLDTADAFASLAQKNVDLYDTMITAQMMAGDVLAAKVIDNGIAIVETNPFKLNP